MTEYNGELYIVGDLDSINGIAINKIAKWNGSVWSSAAYGSNFPLPFTIDRLIFFNGDMYVSGIENDNLPNNYHAFIVKWDGTSWSNIYSGPDLSAISELTVYNGQLCAAVNGQVAVTYQPYFFIIQLNGTTWSQIGGSSIINPYYSISSLIVFNGELYAGGFFD